MSILFEAIVSATALIAFTLYPTLQESNSFVVALFNRSALGKVKNSFPSTLTGSPNFLQMLYSILRIMLTFVLLAQTKDIIHCWGSCLNTRRPGYIPIAFDNIKSLQKLDKIFLMSSSSLKTCRSHFLNSGKEKNSILSYLSGPLSCCPKMENFR